MALRDLAGFWSIRRIVRAQARFTGVAEVRATAVGEFAWRETGELRLRGGAVLAAERRYAYHVDPRAAEIVIRFADGPDVGGLLHRFTFVDDSRSARHRHDCPPDIYDAKLSLISADQFRLTYRVAGPRKTYQMTSSYRRFTPEISA